MRSFFFIKKSPRSITSDTSSCYTFNVEDGDYMKLALVVPCYKEVEVLRDTTIKLNSLFDGLYQEGMISKESFILYVNDGSTDGTWNLIEEMRDQSSWIAGLNLASNVGHQNALYAGLMHVKEDVDVTISIDADLQDDIHAIREMLIEYNKGNDIVYGVRNDRTSDSTFKRVSAQGFYKLMNSLGVKSVYNHADFRLMSARAVKQLANYRERNLFLRGIVPTIGYQTSTVEYARSQRLAGESKYPLKKMISFALDGITSFSIKPISLIFWIGMIAVLVALGVSIYTLTQHFRGVTVTGWSSTMLSIWFLGGIQLIAISIIGQYIGKIYIEVKDRPRYNVESSFEKKDNRDAEENN